MTSADITTTNFDSTSELLVTIHALPGGDSSEKLLSAQSELRGLQSVHIACPRG